MDDQAECQDIIHILLVDWFEPELARDVFFPLPGASYFDLYLIPSFGFRLVAYPKNRGTSLFKL